MALFLSSSGVDVGKGGLQRRVTNFRLSVRFGGVPRQLKTNALKAENRPLWECTPIKRMRQVRLRSKEKVVLSIRPPPLGFISRHRPKLGKLSSRHLLSVSALHSSGSFRDKMLPNLVTPSIGLQITGSAKSQKSSSASLARWTRPAPANGAFWREALR